MGNWVVLFRKFSITLIQKTDTCERYHTTCSTKFKYINIKNKRANQSALVKTGISASLPGLLTARYPG
eukprot:SAG31_NODE_371_length_16628_cov_3.741943_9_plen_68_part_00